MIISLVTATYNSAGTVHDAIASLAGQRHAGWQHLVVDGGSSDATLSVIAESRDPRRRCISERDRGIYDALNKGMAMATGDAIGVLHSDDILADERVLEDVARELSEDSVDGVYGDLEYVARSDVSRVVRRWRSGIATPARLAWGWMPPHPTLFLKSSLVAKAGQYDLGYRISGDYEYILRCLVRERARLKYIPRVLVKMRMGGVSNGSIRGLLRKSGEDLRALRAHGTGGMGALVWKNLSKVGQFL